MRSATLPVVAVGLAVGLMVGLVAACSGGEEGLNPAISSDTNVTIGDDIDDAPQQGPTVSDLTDMLVGRRWVLTNHTNGHESTAIRPTISFRTADDGNLNINGYQGCNWWGSPVELTIGTEGPSIALVGPSESTAMECLEFGPTFRENVAYELEFPNAGALVLRSPEIELSYVDLEVVDRIRPITADDLSSSWVFPGTDLVELAATETGPMFRSWGCSVPVGVTADGELLLEREPNWSACPTPTDSAGIGSLSEVFIDSSGRERVPRPARALVVDDVMYLLGPLSQVYRLERAPASPPSSVEPSNPNP